MVTERLPSSPQSNESLRPDRVVHGIGYAALGYTIETERHGVIRQLEEQRSIHIVSASPYESTDYAEFLRNLLLESSGLSKSRRDLINIHPASRFNENKADKIVGDRLRPFILPMAIGEGRNPEWKVGPIWFINKLTYYNILRQQLEDLQR